MKNVNIILKTVSAVIILSAIATACSKSSSTANSTSDNQTTAALTTSDATSDNLYNDAFNEVMNVNNENGLSGSRVSDANTEGRVDSIDTPHGCATVTVTPKDQSTYPKTVVIDYGSGCTGANGVTRKGKITYSLSGKLTASGTVISVSFTGYSANGYTVEGAYSITNNGSSNGLNITTQVSNGKITYPDGSYYAYSGTKTLVQTAGMSTTSLSDDAYSVTGTSTCSSSDGKSITATITTPLLITASCKNIVSGTINVVYNNIKGVFDYGNGTCDNQATLTIGNSVQTITLL